MEMRAALPARRSELWMIAVGLEGPMPIARALCRADSQGAAAGERAKSAAADRGSLHPRRAL